MPIIIIVIIKDYKHYKDFDFIFKMLKKKPSLFYLGGV